MKQQIGLFISRALNLDLPEFDNIHDYLDYIIPKIRYMGEDLYEVENYLNKRWMEIRDSDDFREQILIIFKESGEYMVSFNGDISSGSWELLNNANTMIINYGNAHELYDLAFLNDQFMILKKHGQHNRKYYIIGLEGVVSGLEWREIVEILFDTYRYNVRFLFNGGIAVFFILILVILSFF